jgi:glycosyltransferase involved in cell wall biosynthesis
MPAKHLRNPRNFRVLLSGCRPPPIGGIAAFYESLLNTSLPDQVNLYFVQTSSQKRELAQSGKITLPNIISAIRDCWRFLMASLSHRSQISHIGTTLGLSFIKHSVCVLISRFVGSHILLHPHCSFSAMYCEGHELWQWFIRQIIRMTDGIVAVSKEWNQINSIIPACQVYYLPNAIDLSPYREIAERNALILKRDKPCKVLYLGYLGKAKGSFDLINVAKQIHYRGIELSFDLVGDELTPGEWKQLEKQISEVELNGYIRMHSAVTGASKIRFFNNADIFVYPSYHEGMPIAVIEAMACGLPIVATKVGGIPDLVKDGFNGFLIEPGKPDQLASTLLHLHNNSQLRFSMQRNSFELAKNRYNIEQRVTELLNIYRDVLSYCKI